MCTRTKGASRINKARFQTLQQTAFMNFVQTDQKYSKPRPTMIRLRSFGLTTQQGIGRKIDK